MEHSFEDVSVPGLSGERRASIGLFADKVARRLSTTYSVNVPDPSTFTAVAKAIFGPSGGGVQCKGVFVDLPEGSLTSQTKEVCIQLCKAKKEVVPLGETEKIISHLVEISPHGKPLSKLAVLRLPTEKVPRVGYEQFLRWTPTQSGEKASWSDVYVCENHHHCDENQTTVELKEGKAKVNTKEFGIFCIISREFNERVEPLRERSTSDAIKAFSGDVSTASAHQRFQSTNSPPCAHGDDTFVVNIPNSYSTHDTVNDDLYTTSSHYMERDRRSSIKGPSIKQRITNKFKKSDKHKRKSIVQTKSSTLNSENNTFPPPPPNPSAPPAPHLSASPVPPSPSDSVSTSPTSNALPPPPPPPPPRASASFASSAPASGESNSLAAMLQARTKNIIG